MTSIGTATRTGQSLVSDQLFGRLVRAVAEHPRVQPGQPERIVEQALAFLAAAAVNVDEPLVPSELVDIGWHAFILHTRDYAAFCERVSGRFIHHVPDDRRPGPTHAVVGTALARTMAAIDAAGYSVDLPLWVARAAKCGDCHEEGNCTASGVDGNENSDSRKK